MFNYNNAAQSVIYYTYIIRLHAYPIFYLFIILLIFVCLFDCFFVYFCLLRFCVYFYLFLSWVMQSFMQIHDFSIAFTEMVIQSVWLFISIVFSLLKGILSTSCVIFSYPNLLSISVLTFIKWRLNTELLMNTLRNVVFSTKKADHRYRKLINYALSWARPTLFIYLFLCCSMDIEVSFYKSWGKKLFANRLYLKDVE
jgi:hypothetical protein